MPFDLQSQKIPVFPNINDSPIQPSAESAGNGSHLIEQYNYLIDLAQFAINNLELQIAEMRANPPSQPDRWRRITQEMVVMTSDKLFLHGIIEGGLDHPIVFYEPGIPVAIRVFNTSNCNIKIGFSPNNRFNNQDVANVFVDANTNKEVGFIYVGELVGWISTEPSVTRVVLPT